MKGLELSRRYFDEVGLPMIRESFPEAESRIAAGLVGEGSECFGYDDELSQDHDFGPGFCLWLTKPDYEAFGKKLQSAYDALPKAFLGYQRCVSPNGQGRVGVFEIGAFYRRFTGLEHAPEDPITWLHLPESYLATATNGAVFRDELGAFSSVRQRYLEYYPEEVRKKKIAARAVQAAQSGQYNYLRCMKRGETVAAGFAVQEFLRAVISMIFLLNRKYMPYYKWMFRGLTQLPRLSSLSEPLKRLSELEGTTAAFDERYGLIEEISRALIRELWTQGLSQSNSDFLQDQAFEIAGHIQDPVLRSRHIMEG